MKDILQWRGKRDEAQLDPETMIYRVEPAASKKAGSDAACKGCAFFGQYAKVCEKAAARAVASNLPDCDSGWIYVLPDPRQIDCDSEQ